MCVRACMLKWGCTGVRACKLLARTCMLLSRSVSGVGWRGYWMNSHVCVNGMTFFLSCVSGWNKAVNASRIERERGDIFRPSCRLKLDWLFLHLFARSLCHWLTDWILAQPFTWVISASRSNKVQQLSAWEVAGKCFARAVMSGWERGALPPLLNCEKKNSNSHQLNLWGA